MSANLTDEQRTALAVLLKHGANVRAVRWLTLALRVKGAGMLLTDLQDAGMVYVVDPALPNPAFRLTAAGVAEARRGR